MTQALKFKILLTYWHSESLSSRWQTGCESCNKMNWTLTFDQRATLGLYEWHGSTTPNTAHELVFLQPKQYILHSSSPDLVFALRDFLSEWQSCILSSCQAPNIAACKSPDKEPGHLNILQNLLSTTAQKRWIWNGLQGHTSSTYACMSCTFWTFKTG